MKICHLIPYFLPSTIFGGPITAVYEMGRALVRRGHDVEVFTTNALTPGNFPSSFSRDEVIDGIKVRRSRVYLRFMTYYFSPGMVNILREDCDVIHAHGYRNFQTDIAAMVSKIRRKPLVITLHGMFTRNVAVERGFKKGQRVYNVYDSLTNLFSLRAARVLLASSNYEYERMPGLKEKTRVMPFGVDYRKYEKLEKGRFRDRHGIDDKKLILYVGRLSRGKNLEALIRVFNSMGEGNAVLAIVGEELPSVHGETNYTEKLRRLAHASKEQGEIIFTGGLYGDRLLEAYADADVFVNPSAAENFGLAMLEAGASGVPVVSTRVGIAPELLAEHGDLLFGSEDELSSILKELIKNGVTRRKIGREIKKKIKEEYSWEKISGRLEGLYEGLME